MRNQSIAATKPTISSFATFIPRPTGYGLAMNRDEKRTRVKGLPPSTKSADGRRVVCPSEPGGGTWLVTRRGSIGWSDLLWLYPRNPDGSLRPVPQVVLQSAPPQ